MAYWDIAEMALDAQLIMRVQACAAQEPSLTQPQAWVAQHMLQITAAPGWDAAWASAIAGGIVDPGKDAGVITDGQILAQVQSVIASGT
jgi:hypothetical protein